MATDAPDTAADTTEAASATVDAPAPAASASGVAGRTDYATWDKVTRTLAKEAELEEQEEERQAKQQLGLDGKYARSEAEAEERKKLKEVKKVKKQLDHYKKREEGLQEVFTDLLGPVPDDIDDSNNEVPSLEQESKSTEKQIVRITRDRIAAGKRVISIVDTSGASQQDTIVLTQDLSNLESKMKAHALTPKSYPGDAENDVIEAVDENSKSTTTSESQPGQPKERSVYGIIKAFINNVHNCTILVKCKIISGTMEIHKCSNVKIIVTSEGTLPTFQVDLSKNIVIEFQDAPSGKNTFLPGQPKVFWGDDKDDRIFHAGVQNMLVRIVRDGITESEVKCHYLKDGAVSIGNATAEEFQFITSVVNGDLLTEHVVRSGQTTGKNVRAMTPREVEIEKERRIKAEKMAVAMAEDMIQIKDKDGNILVSKKATSTEGTKKEEEEEVVEDFYTMSQEQIKDIQNECDQNKGRANEAFGTGEYAQAILLYSLALDKADELPDVSREDCADKQLYPRDILYSNRAACFLKLGQHEKAAADSKQALKIDPKNVKANFRLGLSLHAMQQYREALPVLAKAYKIEPKNKQIQQALQFCEVRLAQEQRKIMEG